MKSFLPFMVALAGCSMPPHAEERTEPPVIVHEEAIRPDPQPRQRQRAVKEKSEPMPKADDLCPPKKGETDQERIIRKLDCLLERD